MGVLRGLGSVLTLPIRGVRAGGQAVIDIFDKDEDEPKKRKEERKSRISDEEFDRWARSIDQERYADDGYGTGRGRDADDMSRRLEAMEADEKGRTRDPEIYGTGDPDFMSEAEARMRAIEQQEKQNTLYTLDVMSGIGEERARQKEAELAMLIKLSELQQMRQNQSPVLQKLLGGAATQNEQDRAQSVAATYAPRRY